MKIAIAQTSPFKGDLENNIRSHLRLVDKAVSLGARMIAFPELSITGYEPTLAAELATTQADKRLDVFQNISNKEHITICASLPTKSDSGIHISLIVFQPQEDRQTYSKQYLHEDELPYFVNGDHQVFLTIGGKKIAPAICYESLLPEHSEQAFQNGAEIYLASVAKPERGLLKAYNHYPNIAKQYSMMVCMANCVGKCDNFVSPGQSAVWNNDGLLLAQMDNTNEGLLIVDTETDKIINWILD